MKSALASLLVILLLAAPCSAAQQKPTTPLQYGTPEVVYSISANYDVADENVAQVDVVFSDAIKDYAYANFVNGELRVSIASVNPINLFEKLGDVTATLNSGTQIAPKLVLTSLKFNGKKATCNLQPGVATVTPKDSAMTVSVPIYNDFPCALTVMVAAYNSSDKMLAANVLQADPTLKEQTLVSTLNGCQEAAYFKVFYLSSGFVPITRAQTVT